MDHVASDDAAVETIGLAKDWAAETRAAGGRVKKEMRAP